MSSPANVTDVDVAFSLLFFFFKQKTAYEMRISDWSSDVCSSDLSGGAAPGRARHGRTRAWRSYQPKSSGASSAPVDVAAPMSFCCEAALDGSPILASTRAMHFPIRCAHTRQNSHFPRYIVEFTYLPSMQPARPAPGSPNRNIAL